MSDDDLLKKQRDAALLHFKTEDMRLLAETADRMMAELPVSLRPAAKLELIEFFSNQILIVCDIDDDIRLDRMS